MDSLNITQKKSRQAIPNTEYGLTASEVNAIVSKINDIVDVVDTLTNTTETLDKKVGVDEVQSFTTNEKKQARTNINSTANIKLSGTITIESIDNLVESGLYEGTLEAALNGTTSLKLMVFGNFADSSNILQVQYIDYVPSNGQEEIIYNSIWVRNIIAGDTPF
jgi:hypothetical protein